ncbi:MAG: CerR family C-terminal domain-containing protein [Planctomycetota bacterium]|jgi:AcrR family transcriptional regulator
MPASQPATTTREALLDAAMRLFSEDGYDAVGIRDIVDLAGANVAAINYHFGSKGELYLAAVRHAMEHRKTVPAWELLDPMPTTRADAAIAIVRFVHRFVQRLLEPGDGDMATKLILREAARPTEALEAVVREFAEPHASLLTGVIAVLDPDATPDECALHAQSILGQALHYRVFRPFLERLQVGSLDDPGRVEEIAGHISRGTLRAIGCTTREIDDATCVAEKQERSQPTSCELMT